MSNFHQTVVTKLRHKFVAYEFVIFGDESLSVSILDNRKDENILKVLGSPPQRKQQDAESGMGTAQQ